MSKYTPGPWYVIDGGTDDSAISTKPQGNHDFDSEVLGYSEWIRVEDADLVLMAAAPDLLLELDNCLDLLITCFPDSPDNSRIGVAVTKARAVIAKATGEAK